MANGDSGQDRSGQAIANVNLQGVQALNAIQTAIKAIFPQGTGTSSSATGGAATLPANPAGFINVTLPSGAQAKVPYYSP